MSFSPKELANIADTAVQFYGPYPPASFWQKFKYRFLSTAKLAALVGVAFAAALGVALLTAPAHSAQTYQVGHDLPSTEQQLISFRFGCFDLDAVTSMIEATHVSEARFQSVTQTLLTAKRCFTGRTYTGAFVGVVAVMAWAGIDDVVVVETRDQNGTIGYTWFTKEYWDKQKIRPMGQGT